MSNVMEFQVSGVRVWKDEEGQWGSTDSTFADRYRLLEELYFELYTGYHPNPDLEFAHFIKEGRNVTFTTWPEQEQHDPAVVY